MLRSIAGGSFAVLACVVLLIPLWLNGAPLYWYDSLAHLHGGSSALNATVDLETRFSNMERAVRPDAAGAQLSAAPADPAGSEPAPEAVGRDAEYRISMARSPYYSVAVVFLSHLGGPFAPVLAQTLLLVASGYFLMRTLCRDRPVLPAVVLLAAISLSTAGVFTATLLPDFLAPLGILAVAVLFCFHERLSALDRTFWMAVLVLGVISHTSHIAITLLLIPVGLILAALRRQRRWLAPAASCFTAVVIGVMSMQIFAATVENVYGYKPRSFPMIAASVIVDGPGKAYLEQTCPDNGYVYCDYLYTEARNIDEFLWAADRSRGVFHYADADTRDRMSDEQFGFLIDVLKHDFGAQFQASWARFTQQLQKNSLEHMAYDARLRGALSGELPDPDRQLMEQSAAYAGQFPFAGLSQMSLAASMLALAGTVLVLIRTGRAGVAQSQVPVAVMVSFLVIVLCGIVANAGITGALSNPQGRYGARVIWLLLPVFALVLTWSRCSVSRRHEAAAVG